MLIMMILKKNLFALLNVFLKSIFSNVSILLSLSILNRHDMSSTKGTSLPQWNGGIEAEAVQPQPKQILFLLEY